MTQKLPPSEKQAKILKFIESEMSRNGRSPTYRDIAEHFGYEAVGTVQDHVRALVKKGYLQKQKGVARGLTPSYRESAIQVPILGHVPAGRPTEALEDIQGMLTVPSKWRGELFALQVKGDSMIEAGIHEGDYVVIKRQDHAENGEIVVALIDGEATVKYLEQRAGRYRLLPANARYSPIELTETRANTIQGKVVAVQRFYGHY